MSAPSRYPLAWPPTRPRRRPSQRIKGSFSEAIEAGISKKSRPVTLSTATERLEDQVSRLGGMLPILSSNVELRLDGRPRADRAPPADPAVCLYFQLKGEPYAMACDTFSEVAQNIAAIANHISATRAIERYGVATAAETLRAFAALPPPIVTPPPVDWREVFGVMRASEEEIGALYRLKAKAAPNEEALRKLNMARDAALAEIKGARGGGARLAASA